ncbi:MAG: helix-turn-helix transcriptional regulator [Bryobacteraceae bacterium]|nr:helix-turn-helix transcriptional regulator [Bryobacteraceae bacterium]
MSDAKRFKKLLPLTPPVFHILLALTDADRHGYGIMQEVSLQTRGEIRLGPGTLYGCLKRMQASGLVEESEQRPVADLDDERRRYYRVTEMGQCVVRAEANRLAEALQAATAKLLVSVVNRPTRKG